MAVKFFEFKHTFENNAHLYKTSDLDPNHHHRLNTSADSNSRVSIITFNKIHLKLEEILKEFKEISQEYFKVNYNELINATIKRISYINQSESMYSSTIFANVLQPNESSLLS